MNDPWSRQSRFNFGSLDQWDGFANHRDRVTQLLSDSRETIPGRLCVLGVGNGNDLDLAALETRHREIHLVDLDADALDRAVDRQGVAACSNIHRHGGLDLTGMLDVMARWTPLSPLLDADVRALVNWPSERVGLTLPGTFDRVASTCLLSQIIGNAHHTIGEAHPRFAEVVRAIRLGHLRLMARLTRPGGRMILITDVVSSDNLPGLLETSESALPALLGRLARGGGLIHGVNPAEIGLDFDRDPILSKVLHRVAAEPPWRWKLHERVYLVLAITADRRA